MNKWTQETITDFLSTHSDTLRQMGVRKIGLFGSYVRDEQHKDSDIDLLLVMDNFTFVSWMDVWNYLEDNLGCEIDLVPEKDLRDELRPTVLSEVHYVEVT